MRRREGRERGAVQGTARLKIGECPGERQVRPLSPVMTIWHCLHGDGVDMERAPLSCRLELVNTIALSPSTLCLRSPQNSRRRIAPLPPAVKRSRTSHSIDQTTLNLNNEREESCLPS